MNCFFFPGEKVDWRWRLNEHIGLFRGRRRMNIMMMMMIIFLVEVVIIVMVMAVIKPRLDSLPR